MARVIGLLGWLLIAVALGMVVVGFWVPLCAFELLKTGALLAGVLLALAGHLFTQARAMKDSIEKRSQFYLESCVKGYEEAWNLLHDGNNDRATWIAAARALMHGKELSGKVKEDAHLRVLELHKLRYRRFFHQALADKPAAFFYGADDTSIPTDEAAKLSTAREKRGGRDIASPVKELSEKSLYAIWEAAQFPQEYKDPLQRGFPDEEKSRLLVRYPGLHEYLEHKKQLHSASGKLFPRDNDGSR